jgi:hypothetical protein
MTLTKKLICILSVIAVLMSLTACEMPMKIVGSIPDPKDTVTTFFDSVCAGRFAESDKYLSGVSLSMKKQVEGEFAKKLYDYLIQSYDYKINGEVTCDLLDANCKVDFTYLDFNLLSGDLKKISTKLGKRYVTEAKDGYVEEKDGAYSLSDEGAEKVAAEALDSLMKEADKYRSTRSFDIVLKYSNGKWLIDLPDELFYAICGGFDLSE